MFALDFESKIKRFLFSCQIFFYRGYVQLAKTIEILERQTHIKKVATYESFVYTRTLLKTQKSIKVSTFSFHFQQPLCQTNF